MGLTMKIDSLTEMRKQENVFSSYSVTLDHPTLSAFSVDDSGGIRFIRKSFREHAIETACV